MIKLFLKEIADKYIRENFKKLQMQLQDLSKQVTKVEGTTTYITERIPLDGSEDISGTIEPDTASTHDIGSTSKPLRSVYSDEIYLSGNSLYIAGKKSVNFENNMVTYSAPVNEDLTVKSRGTGTLYIDAEGDVIISSSGDVVVNGRAITASDHGRERFFVTDILNNNNSILLQETPRENSCKVFLDGLFLDEGSSNDYTITGNHIAFNSGAISPTNEKVVVVYTY